MPIWWSDWLIAAVVVVDSRSRLRQLAWRARTVHPAGLGTHDVDQAFPSTGAPLPSDVATAEWTPSLIRSLVPRRDHIDHLLHMMGTLARSAARGLE